MERKRFYINAGTVAHPLPDIVSGMVDEATNIGYHISKRCGRTFTGAYDLNTGCLIILQLGRAGCQDYIKRHWQSIMSVRENEYYGRTVKAWNAALKGLGEIK